MDLSLTIDLQKSLAKEKPLLAEWFFFSQITRKPGSVLADHLSSLSVAAKIERFL